jgi:hypothetical protein
MSEHGQKTVNTKEGGHRVDSDGVDCKRSAELRQLLCERLELDENQVSDVLRALIGAIHDRLGRGLQACLISWIPETWLFLANRGAAVHGLAARGEAAIVEKVVDAGLPADRAPELVRTLLGFLEVRCGRPLSEAVRRRAPELGQLAARAPREPVEPMRMPAGSPNAPRSEF